MRSRVVAIGSRVWAVRAVLAALVQGEIRQVHARILAKEAMSQENKKGAHPNKRHPSSTVLLYAKSILIYTSSFGLAVLRPKSAF